MEFRWGSSPPCQCPTANSLGRHMTLAWLVGRLSLEPQGLVYGHIYDPTQLMGISPFGLFCQNYWKWSPLSDHGAKDYVSLELPACHLCCHMETLYLRVKSRISRTRRLWGTSHKERRQREREGNPNPANIPGLEPNLPKGISWDFHVHQ